MDSSANNTWNQCWWFQFWCLWCNIWQRQQWSRVNLGHRAGCLEQYPGATKNICAMQTKTRRQDRLISYTLILGAERKLFCLMIQRRKRSSLDVIVFNRCPCSNIPPKKDGCSHEYGVGLFRCHLLTHPWFSTSPSEKVQNLTTEHYFQRLHAGYWLAWLPLWHYCDVIIGKVASQDCLHNRLFRRRSK